MTRWKINEAAREVLEEQYLRKRFPSPLSKKRLAEQLDVAPRRIQVWFQNRRQREKAGAEDEPPAQPHGRSLRAPAAPRAPLVRPQLDAAAAGVVVLVQRDVFELRRRRGRGLGLGRPRPVS